MPAMPSGSDAMVRRRRLAFVVDKVSAVDAGSTLSALRRRLRSAVTSGDLAAGPVFASALGRECARAESRSRRTPAISRARSILTPSRHSAQARFSEYLIIRESWHGQRASRGAVQRSLGGLRFIGRLLKSVFCALKIQLEPILATVDT